MHVRNLRWWIAGLLAAATALNYLDRQSLPVVVTEVQKTIPITDQQYANLQMLFLLAYGVMYAVGGKIMDCLGTRLGYAIMIVWWSAAAVLHGLVGSVLGLGAARFLLGLGEGAVFRDRPRQFRSGSRPRSAPSPSASSTRDRAWAQSSPHR